MPLIDHSVHFGNLHAVQLGDVILQLDFRDGEWYPKHEFVIWHLTCGAHHCQRDVRKEITWRIEILGHFYLLLERCEYPLRHHVCRKG